MVILTHQDLVQSFLSMPDAPIILDELKQTLEEEKKRRLEFYNQITDAEKVEFINGEIIVHSPVKKEHNDVTKLLSMCLTAYVLKNKLGYIGIEKIMITLTRNDYEPDICFFKKEKSNNFKKGQSLFPAPDLVVEILSKGTAKNDRGIKFQDYQAHKVEEYWIIDPKKKVVEQYRLDEHEKYELILKASEGSIISKAIEGFKIPIKGIFNEQEGMLALAKLMK